VSEVTPPGETAVVGFHAGEANAADAVASAVIAAIIVLRHPTLFIIWSPPLSACLRPTIASAIRLRIHEPH
jgi:hypothetical protein